MTKSLAKFDGYAGLLKTVRAAIDKGRTTIERQQVITYWNVGKYISDYILKGEKRAEFGQETFKKLSKDLELSVDVLERTVRFAREYPISAARRKLRSNHFKTLLTVKDPDKRLELEKKIEQQGLDTDQLQAEINAYRLIQSREKFFKAPQTIPQLSLVRGQMYSYKIISPLTKISLNNSAVIDCGFNFWREIPTRAKGLKSGEMIRTEKAQDARDKSTSAPEHRNTGAQDTIYAAQDYRIIKSPLSAKDLYTYKAYLERIIDGDTIVLNIDVGFRNYTRQKVRFARIDTPEISTDLGVKAKAYVEKILKPLDFFVIKTYKFDKYTRYLVDIFYLPGERDPQKIADQGQLLNQDLLNEGLARVWGE